MEGMSQRISLRACAVCSFLVAVALVAAACAGDPSTSGPTPGVPAPGGGALPEAGAIVSAAIPRSLLPAAMAGSGSLVFVCTYLGRVNVSVSAQGTNVDESCSIEGSVVGSQYDGALLGLGRQPLDEPRSLRLPAGQSYRFLLSDIAPNCRVDGDNPATVAVGSGVTTSLNFYVACE